jgi:hypothetical protein
MFKAVSDSALSVTRAEMLKNYLTCPRPFFVSFLKGTQARLMTEDRNDDITKKRSIQARLFKRKKKYKNRKTLSSLPAIHRAMNEAQDSVMDLNAWGLHTEAARELYASLNRIRYLYGNVLTRVHITQAVKRSSQEIEQALSELESAGLIVYDKADDEVQVVV